jgi:hypothetical protein
MYCPANTEAADAAVGEVVEAYDLTFKVQGSGFRV